MTDVRRRLTELHDEFIREQSEVQRQYLTMQSRASRRLLDRCRGEGSADPGVEGLLDARVDPPAVDCRRTSFGPRRLEAYADGDIHGCFGPGFERAEAHTETPLFVRNEPLGFDEVENVEPGGNGEAHGRFRVSGESATWSEGTVYRALAFYLCGLGYTLDRDGWRYEKLGAGEKGVFPTSGEAFEGRGILNLVLREVVAEPWPRVVADVDFMVDGELVERRERLGVRLVPGWPLERHPEWLEECSDDPRAATVEGVTYDRETLLAFALGRPSRAFGSMYAEFDEGGRFPRLPGPPYHLVTRVTDVDATQGEPQEGVRAVTEYDVPDDAWYFDAGGTGAMPYCVLLEVGLQPCGWLASFSGCALTTDRELFFRNLDGRGDVLGRVGPDTRRLRTTTILRSITSVGDTSILAFDVEVRADGELVFSLETVFGFFTLERLAQQVGLPTSDEQQRHFERHQGSRIDLRSEPAEYFRGVPCMPRGEMLMLDEISGLWPEGGEEGLGRLRAEIEVDPTAWYFQAHFFQDPVQPGSLGLEAMLQVLQFHMIDREMGESLEQPSFEPILHERTMSWKYRGQVVPENDRVTVEIEIVEEGEDEGGAYVVATGSLWVDGLKIYEANGLGMRLTESGKRARRRPGREVLDPEVDTWLKDHRPTFTRPALPMMSIIDRLAAAALEESSAEHVVEIRDVELHRWLIIDEAVELEICVESTDPAGAWHTVTLSKVREREDGEVRLDRVATGDVRCADAWPSTPEPMPSLENAHPLQNPYESGQVFHGPAFQLLESAHEGRSGACGVLNAAGGAVPRGLLHPAVLDGMFHIIPHGDLTRWSDRVPDDMVGYPHRLESMTLHGPTPEGGKVCVDMRLVGFKGSEKFPVFRAQFGAGGQIWADVRVVHQLFPKGRIVRGSPEERRRFLRDREYVFALGLSRFDEDATRLSLPEIRKNDWFEGTVQEVYRVDGDLREQALAIVVKDHLAQRLEVHPSDVEVGPQSDRAARAGVAGRQFDLRIEKEGPMTFAVTEATELELTI